MFRRHWDPALPKEPVLLIDERRGLARVIVKAVDFGATVRGDLVTGLLWVPFYLLPTWIAYQAFMGGSSRTEENAKFFAVFAVGWFVATMLIAGFVILPSMIRKCATRVSLNFGPAEIRIGRKRFSRVFNGEPVRYGFQIAHDPKAQERLATDGKLGLKRRHLLSTSRRVVMAVQPGTSALSGRSAEIIGPGVLHDVLTVLGDDNAEEILGVLIAAACVTEPAKPWEQSDGDAGRFDADLL